MVDRLSKSQRSENMRRIRSRDTKPELLVRRQIFKLGYRYRLGRKDLPGKPDLVFGPRRKVIFVHGCFWHQHSITDCIDGKRPKSNTEYWNAKLDRNVDRDRINYGKLAELGWEVLTIWDCETADIPEIVRRITRFLGPV